VSYRSQLATFEITDTGIGISPDDIERVFDPFDRGTHPDAQRQKGVGIGLSITNALVHILGGDLQVSSEVGKGTRFTARLMLGHIAAPTAEKAPESIKGYGGERRSVLLIDDDSSQLAILRSLLEPLGFRVHEALSGAAGIAIAAREPPDLVLLDISMPGESGWDVARSLRDAHGSAIRIVMISANAHEFRRGSDGISSHDMFLMKPVSLDALLDVVADQLQLHWDGTEDERATHAAMAQPYAFAILPETAAPYLAEIEQKALIGHVRGMESKIRELQSVVPEAEPLAAHLLACLDRFDLKGLTAAIKASW
jgi:CheY-like chemotaxis protein